MKKSIVVFHNASGMIEEMKALFESTKWVKGMEK